jgi:PucR C-terminal helix-turn-helix domain/GGDEF-like domain
MRSAVPHRLEPLRVSEGDIVRIGERVAARRDEIAELEAERIMAEVPAYRHAGEELLDDVILNSRQNVRALGDALAGHARLDRQTLDFIGQHAHLRVAYGISLESLLHAYRVGGNVLWEQCMQDAVAFGVSRDTGLELARLTFDQLDVLTTHTAQAYLREEARVRTVRDEASRNLLELLILGQADFSWAERHPAAPGLDPGGELVVFVVAVANSAGPLIEAVQEVRAAVSDVHNRSNSAPLVALRQGVVVGVASAQDQEWLALQLAETRNRLDAADGELFKCGISAPCDGFGGVRGAYEQAIFALSRASREQPVVGVADMPSLQYALSSAPSPTRTLIAARASKLAALDEQTLSKLRQTVHAFADANLNITRAASALYVHPNTLRYRLKRIREQSGQDPHTVAGMTELLCILEALRDPTLRAGDSAGRTSQL